MYIVKKKNVKLTEKTTGSNVARSSYYNYYNTFCIIMYIIIYIVYYYYYDTLTENLELFFFQRYIFQNLLGKLPEYDTHQIRNLEFSIIFLTK